MSKRGAWAIFVAAVVVVVAVAIGMSRSSSTGEARPAASAANAPPAAAPGASEARTAAAPAASAAKPTVGDGGRRREVRRLASEERRRLGEQIAAARQKAREAAAAAGGSDADELIPVEDVGKPVKDAMSAAIPLLAGCYTKQPGSDALREAAALMTMTSDPELGTVIDTEGITDAAGEPLAAQLDECLRDTIDSLAMPPLGRGGKVKVQYTFRFE